MKTLLSLSLGLLLPLSALAIDFESNVPADVQEHVKADLAMMANVQGTGQTALHQSIYGGVNGDAYAKWFQDRIVLFGYDSGTDPSFPAVAYNDSASGKDRHMMVTDYFVKGNLPQMARVMVLYHEARHSEAEHGYWMHINCPAPYRDEQGNDIKSIISGRLIAGLPACDRTYQGAYGTTVTLLGNLNRYCSNCNEKTKADAELYGTDQITRLVQKSDQKKLTDDLSAARP